MAELTEVHAFSKRGTAILLSSLSFLDLSIFISRLGAILMHGLSLLKIEKLRFCLCSCVYTNLPVGKSQTFQRLLEPTGLCAGTQSTPCHLALPPIGAHHHIIGHFIFWTLKLLAS